MSEILLKFFQNLKKGKLLSSQVPKAVSENNDFQNMLDNGIIIKSNVGRGYVYKLNEERREVFENWFVKKFPNPNIEVQDRASSIAKFKYSKKSKSNSTIVFLKGKKSVIVNKEIVDLDLYTQKFSFFACVLESLETEKLCFVENKESFLQAEKLISIDYVFIHSYGRIGKGLLSKIQTKEVLVFSDYDYVGLNEYLKCKSVFENTTFFVPENYNFLFEKYARDMKLNRKKGQTAFTNVLASQDEVVMRICKDLQSKQKFLEQESLLINL
jgi:hypothetical protein